MRAKDIYVGKKDEIRLVIDVPLHELIYLAGIAWSEFMGETCNGSVFRLIKILNTGKDTSDDSDNSNSD